MFRRILVPIDGGEGSRLDLERAVDLAVPANADVHLLAVAEPTGGPLLFDVGTVDGIDRAIEELAEAVLLAGGGRDNRIEFRTVVRRHASPTTAILADAVEVDADLVVVGRRATGGDARELGTTARGVAEGADVAVLLVPPSEKTPSDGQIDGTGADGGVPPPDEGR